NNPASARARDAANGRCVLAEVAREADADHLGVFGAEMADDLPSFVLATIIDQDQFMRATKRQHDLLHATLQLTQSLSAVVYRHDDGNIDLPISRHGLHHPVTPEAGSARNHRQVCSSPASSGVAGHHV